MIKFKVTFKNYRCFPYEAPCSFTIGTEFTAFIGPNNLGKSTILRFFYEFRQFFGLLNPGRGEFIALLRGGSVHANLQGVTDLNEVFNNKSVGNEMIVDIEILEHEVEESDKVVKKCSIIYRKKEINFLLNLEHSAFPNDASRGGISIDPDGIVKTQSGAPSSNCQALIQVFKMLEYSIYIGSFRNALQSGSDNYYDLSIGIPFIKSWDEMKTGKIKKNNEKILALTREIREILGFKSLDISSTPEKDTLHIVIDDKPYQLRELGSGIAQLIVVIAQTSIREPPFVFIDEPELSLHPSLQVEFLNILAKYSKGIAFTTHSIGLARTIGNSVFSLMKDQNKVVKCVEYDKTNNVIEFLNIMSFGLNQEIGFKKILLVEGQTEVLFYKQFMRLKGKESDFVFIPLGGSSLINSRQETKHILSDLTRITSKIFCIIDSECKGAEDSVSPDREGFRTVCESLGIKTLILKRRASENYLTTAAIQLVKGNHYTALGQYEKLSDKAGSKWNKSENWKIADRMTLAEWIDSDLGEFLMKICEEPQ